MRQLKVIAVTCALLVVALCTVFVGTGAATPVPVNTPLYALRSAEAEATMDDKAEVREEGEPQGADVLSLSASLQSLCVFSGCFGSVCTGSGCVVSYCIGSACLESKCFSSNCVGSGCPSYCSPYTECVTNSYCMGSNCATSGCPLSTYCESSCQGGQCKVVGQDGQTVTVAGVTIR